MNKIIYAIKVADLSYTGLKILDVKIGQTTNVNSTVAQYRRSHREVEILDLWESNPSKTLSECEGGIHEIAEKYAYERKGEKFIFLQESYKDFSENVNLLLKNVQRDEGSEVARKARVYNEEDVLRKCSDSQKEIIRELMGFIEGLDDNIQKIIRKGVISYKHKAGNSFVNIGSSKKEVRIYSDYGYKLDDEENILRGRGMRGRHIKISSVEEIDQIKPYIKQAFEISKKENEKL